MQFSIENTGIIHNAKISLNGLTVIGGENDTGKSTIGKLLFAIVKGISRFEQDLHVSKEKSLNRVKELRSDDRALILVSHAMQTLRDTCNDVAWLHKGKLIQRGEPNQVIDAYQEFLHLGKSAAIDEDV